jgi:hypothetical protein
MPIVPCVLPLRRCIISLALDLNVYLEPCSFTMARRHHDYDFSKTDLDEVANRPWFLVTAPVNPLPAPSARAAITTERLVVRPLVDSDLESFHRLRSNEQLQLDSFARGRAEYVDRIYYISSAALTAKPSLQ